MDLYTILQPQTPHSSNYTLHLLELNDEILKTMQIHDSNEKLSKLNLKSTSNESSPVLVTHDKTFKIRQQNHSNCVMLLNVPDENVLAEDANSGDGTGDGDEAVVVQQFTNQYVLTEVTMAELQNDPVLNSRIPKLGDLEELFSVFKELLKHYDDGDMEMDDDVSDRERGGKQASMKQLFENCSMSVVQFESFLQFHDIVEFGICGGVLDDEVEGDGRRRSEMLQLGCFKVDEEQILLPCVWEMIHFTISYFLDVLGEVNVMKGFEFIPLNKNQFLKKFEKFLDKKSRDDIDEEPNDKESEVELKRQFIVDAKLKITGFCIDKFFESVSSPASDDEGGMKEGLKLLNDRVVKSFGHVELIKLGSKSVRLDDFLINLKTQLPFNYNPEIDVDTTLKGYFFYEVDPNAIGSGGRGHGHHDKSLKEKRKIRFLDEEILSLDVAARLKELFKLKSKWEISEIEPFVKRVNVKHLKIDKFLLKFCRVKKEGKRTFVTKR
ncbi:unnamed protein product [Ambrosiozyma monospora]|uniref:Unnamed protein product n=1 Tax=Ambrosiozyma monospora TaxID=43982 RepID=A0ACB5SR33_AMBMO|nr:unnamed protein product [Ambrosiozyma monospora]